MPGATTRYGLPYPQPGDSIADAAAIIKSLAEAIEAELERIEDA